jgi:predicted dehydrogenase
MTQSRRLKGVGIGAGYFAPFHYEAWTRIPEVDIVALCDRTEEKARPVMAAHGIPRSYADWRQMLDAERPDFVDIITPPIIII